MYTPDRPSSRKKCITKSYQVGTIPITACQINRGNYTIYDPGVYILVDDVEWTPLTDTSVAIHVKSKNVTLDLQGHSIEQVNTFEPRLKVTCQSTRPHIVSGNIGILVDTEDTVSVIIRNGTISNIQGVGLMVSDFIQDVLIEDITTFRCGDKGAVDTSYYYRSGGIFVTGKGTPNCGNWNSNYICSHIIIRRCNSLETVTNDNEIPVYGILVLFCNDVIIEECNVNLTLNRGTRPDMLKEPNCVGIGLVCCSNVTMRHSISKDNNSRSQTAGIFAWGYNFIFEDCISSNNSAISTKFDSRYDSSLATGFDIAYSQNVSFIRCEASMNYVDNVLSNKLIPDTGTAGFHLSGQTIQCLFQDCVAKGNWSNSKILPTAGFLLNGSSRCVFRNCISTSNAGLNNDFAGYMLTPGLIYDVDVEPNIGNEFYNCISSGNTYQWPFYNKQVKPMFEYPLYMNDKTNTSTAANGAGFYITDQIQCKIIDCNSNSNKGRGILLKASVIGSLPKHIVSNNTITDNEYHGIDIDGILESVVIYGNKASLNGNNASSDNYVGIPTGTLIVNWNLTSGQLPSQSISSLENTSVY